MPFVKVEVTPEESKTMLLRDEELNRVYQSTGGGKITAANPHNPPRYLYINEEEDASFCLLSLGSDVPLHDSRHLYILRINKDYIIFQLANGKKTVRFIHRNSLLDNQLYRVKYLILAGLESAGYWGDGVNDVVVDAVLDPAFEFAPGIRS